MTGIVVLISGRGSNMESLAKNVGVQAVVCNVPGAAGIKIAQDMGIECIVEPAMDGIVSILDSLDPGLVCMAGFMRILPSHVTERYSVMNIHPSLLPLFPGLHAQRQAVEEGGVRYSGCTVHMADAGVDTGGIILQDAVPVMPGDTEDTLSDRIILKEHEAYVRAVRLFLARNDIGASEPGGSRFDGAGKAAEFAVGCGKVAYLWNSGGNTFAVSEKRRPANTPYVVSVPGDDADVVSARLRNMVDW